MRPIFSLAGACLFVLFCRPTFSQVFPDASGHRQESKESREDKDSRESKESTESQEEGETRAVFELGAATDWGVRGGAALFAPSIAAEITPIPKRLTVEAGFSPYYTRKSSEWDVDLLFKKPWSLSRTVEVLLGVGPQWNHISEEDREADAIRGEVAGEVMVWGSKKHRLGWFVEPAYEYSFAAGHTQSMGMTTGLLIGIP